MKNRDILILANNGILNARYATIDGAHAYKMFKFRKEISKALNAYTESYKELLKSNDIEDIDAFNKRIEELQVSGKQYSKEEEAELKASLEKRDKIEEIFKSLLEDDVTLDCKPMPFSEYHKLWLENRTEGKMSLFEYENVIDMLEGVLWHPDE